MALNRDILKKLNDIFLPTSSKAIESLYSQKQRLVHYTSADAALKIIETKTMWLRNTRVMNDWSEVAHGFELLNNYFRDRQFVEIMGACHEGSGEEVLSKFHRLWQLNYQDTYISCFSQHLESEDQYGRLSMWRAFGNETAGVALVMNPPPQDSAEPLRVFLHPVSYQDEKDLKKELDTVVTNIKANQAFLKTIDKEMVITLGYLTLMLATVATKHKGFKEEREWRLLHSPVQFFSPHVQSSNKTVKGIPQEVYELKLENKPTEGINNIELRELLDRVIIGPTPYADSIHRALAKALKGARVENVEAKIFHSNIPLR